MTVRELRQKLFDIEEQDKEITLEELKKIMEEHEKNHSHYCIFEKRICQYANKNGNVFNCKAPSDDDMTCR